MKWFQFIVALFLLNIAFGRHWKPQDFPNPTKEFEECGRKAPSFLCDPDRILSNDGATAVENRLRKLANEELVSCGGSKKSGVQIGVALVKQMDLSRFRKEFAAKRFAKNLQDEWGVGLAGCNNGIVLFLSKRDRYMYIATGSGVKRSVTDTQSSLVIEDMKDFLRAGQFNDAVIRGVENLSNILHGKPMPEPSWISFETVFIAIILVIFGGVAYKSYRDEQIRREARNRVTRVQREAERQRRARRFAQESCPICLDEFDENSETQILDCGHKFCIECLGQWENTQQRTRANNYRSTCPICREVIEDEKSSFTDDLRRAMGGQSDHCERRNVRSYDPMMDAFVFNRLMDADRNFRLRSLHRMYPQYVTTDMMHDIERGTYTGSWTDHPSFVPPQPPSGGYSGGGSGFSSSFGGGSSSGGGGSGGGW